MSTGVCLMGEDMGQVSLVMEKGRGHGDSHRGLLVVTPRENYRQM